MEEKRMGIGVGLFLLAVGAILTFAVHVSTNSSGIDLNTIGVILMVVGGLGIILSFLFWNSLGFGDRRGNDTVIREREVV
jgi:hypothetical protein